MFQLQSYTKQVVRHIHGIQTMQQIAEKARLSETIKGIQNWQKLRFLDTQQVLFQDRACNSATVFIASHVFQFDPFDCSDPKIIESYSKASKFISREIKKAILLTLELKCLSVELDFELAKQLHGQPLDPINCTNAYIQSQALVMRQKQAEALHELCVHLHAISHARGTKWLLSMYRKPAENIGLSQLHSFVDAGLKVFSDLPKSDFFIKTLIKNEHDFVHKMLANPLTPQLNRSYE